MSLASTVRDRYPSIRARWRKRLRAIVYVPVVAESMLNDFEYRGSAAFKAELERLAVLGASWAAALLAYQALLLRPDGTRDTARAIALCEHPAARADAFAQYILAWALLLGPKPEDAFAMLNKSALQQFPPAILDGAAFFMRGWGVAKGADDRVLKSLALGEQVGHRATLLIRCHVYRTGRLGMFKRLLGYMLTPVGTLMYAAGGLLSPFSAQVFLFRKTTTVDAFGFWDPGKKEWMWPG